MHQRAKRWTGVVVVTACLAIPTVLGGQASAVPRGTADDCSATGSTLVTVPNVVGKRLKVAIRRTERAGLTVVGTGTASSDPTDRRARVSAQEPGAGEQVPQGSCVGFRTTDEPKSSGKGKEKHAKGATPDQPDPTTTS